MPLFIVGILLTNFINSPILALIGAWLYVFVVIFQIITLPVEFNASARALTMLRDYNFLDETEPVGRKLDFLVQEMNREVNTIGSKTTDIDITNLVVDVKSEIDKIREQIQNIE